MFFVVLFSSVALHLVCRMIIVLFTFIIFKLKLFWFSYFTDLCGNLRLFDYSRWRFSFYFLWSARRAFSHLLFWATDSALLFTVLFFFALVILFLPLSLSSVASSSSCKNTYIFFVAIAAAVFFSSIVYCCCPSLISFHFINILWLSQHEIVPICIESGIRPLLGELVVHMHIYDAAWFGSAEKFQ